MAANEKLMLELRSVSHVYVGRQGASLAVEDMSLMVARGEFISLVGPSGCGKTTVLSLLAGLFPPASGQILMGGRPVEKPSAKVGYMLQQDCLLPWRTIRDNAALGLQIGGVSTAQAHAAAERLLEEVGLAGTGTRYPGELSGGMRQRVALARTLAPNPEVLLLDEPFSALDMHIKMQLEDLVQATLRKLGKTAVLVTHDLAEAAAMSDRVLVLGRDPGHIRTELQVPEELRVLPPTEARKHPAFQAVFDALWEEMGADEKDGGNSA
ncbi:ABC transporter ATP-binding protein [Paenibacillus herberti]|uniref:Spermidine/putrescine ABC transporter ATP-binding protein n=1 Tax=Paenibacillus herberti TaxID=1619309 RepID=A0A229P3L3_9BACL|nr:ABC transporter ATP-binding protein [Paenibacillus herberti]OXM16495.1 spermidine/putrescine ABC transporter ATP-binding protein [Paenibacillus herberti]